MDIPFIDSFSPEARVWFVTPLLIFCARLIDVSIGTMRIVFLSRGYRLLAPMLGFVEVLVWLLAIRQVFTHLENPAAFIAYAAGFAAGNYLGLWMESKLAVGLVAVRIITAEDSRDMIAKLNNQDFGVTTMAARGVSGDVQLTFTIVPRRKLHVVVEIVRTLHPRAFISTSDVRSVMEGVFPEGRYRIGGGGFPGFLRKGK